MQPTVLEELPRTGVLDHLGRERVHWSADRAILAVRREEGMCPSPSEGTPMASSEGMPMARLVREKQPA